MTGPSQEFANLAAASAAYSAAEIAWALSVENRLAGTPPVTGGPACGLPGYTLDWEWTFGDGGTIPDIATLQTLCNPGLPWGRINGEFQRYVTDWNPANIEIAGDELRITAMPTRGIGYDQIDSAEIVSKKGYDLPVAGILEWEFKAPAGLGMWPAGWLYAVPPANSDEIDGFEIVYNQADGQRDTTHGVFVNDHVGSGQAPVVAPGSLLDQWGKWVAPFDFAQGFHTLAVQFDGDTKTRWCDKTSLVTRTWKWTSPPPAIIVNLACGATNPPTDFPGQPNAASFQNGANILAVRAVRAWKK